MTLKFLPLLLLTAMLLPAASATVSVTGPDAENQVISATDDTTITYTVTVSCDEFVSQSKQSIAVSLETDLPSYYGEDSETVNVSPGTDCVGIGGTVSQDVDLTLSPTEDAIGLVARTYTVTANAGSSSGEFAHAKSIQIDYLPGHSIDTSIDFPYNFTDADNGTIEFQIFVTVTANGKTMIMFNNPDAGGSASGFTHPTFDVAAGETSTTLNVTYTPPSGAWTNDTITFYAYSHCLDGAGCAGPYNPQNFTWVINNMATPVDSGTDNESPGAPVMVLALALVGIAFVLRRRS